MGARPLLLGGTARGAPRGCALICSGLPHHLAWFRRHGNPGGRCRCSAVGSAKPPGAGEAGHGLLSPLSPRCPPPVNSLCPSHVLLPRPPHPPLESLPSSPSFSSPIVTVLLLPTLAAAAPWGSALGSRVLQSVHSALLSRTHFLCPQSQPTVTG